MVFRAMDGYFAGIYTFGGRPPHTGSATPQDYSALAVSRKEHPHQHLACASSVCAMPDSAHMIFLLTKIKARIETGIIRVDPMGTRHACCTVINGNQIKAIAKVSEATHGHAIAVPVSKTKKRDMRFARQTSWIALAISITQGANSTWLYGANIGIMTKVVACTAPSDHWNAGLCSPSRLSRHSQTISTVTRIAAATRPPTGVNATSSTDRPPPVYW